MKWLTGAQYSPEQRRRVLPFKLDAGVGAQLPTRAHPDDAGLDLYVSQQLTVMPGEFVDVPCGVAVGMESHQWGLLIGRSSTLRKRGLMVNPGIIDPGYRGELYAGVFNLGQHAQTLAVGERVAQFILLSNQTQTVVPIAVEALGDSARGVKGFGSSGA